MIDTKKFYACLLRHKVDFFCGVPDSLLKEFCSCVLEQAGPEKNIICANEGNAVALAAGHYLSTGNPGCVYMQNSGLGNGVNPLVSLTDEAVYRIPALLLIGWRGEPDVPDEPQHKKQGKITLPLLETLGVWYKILDDTYETQIRECMEYMQDTGRAAALVVKKNTFAPFTDATETAVSDMDLTLTREEALEEIVRLLTPEDLIVSTTGKTSRELYEIRERNGQSHDRDFLTVGAMGHTASLALGISMGTQKDVYCIDGDGSFLMHMGGLSVAADVCRRNFKYILINNGCHDSVGGQPTVGFHIGIPEILRGMKFREVVQVRDAETLRSEFYRLKEERTAMVIYCRKGSRKDLGRPARSPQQNKADFMRRIIEVSDESNYI